MLWTRDRLYSFPKPPATLLQEWSYGLLTGQEAAANAAAKVVEAAIVREVLTLPPQGGYQEGGEQPQLYQVEDIWSQHQVYTAQSIQPEMPQGWPPGMGQPGMSQEWPFEEMPQAMYLGMTPQGMPEMPQGWPPEIQTYHWSHQQGYLAGAHWFHQGIQQVRSP